MGLCGSRTILDGADVPGRRLNKKGRRIVEQYLPSFKDIERFSTLNDQKVILNHWDFLMSQMNSTQGNSAATSSIVQIFDNFYSFLFDIAPQVKPLFRASMHVQGKALVRIITAIKTMLADPQMVKRCSELAERHVKYGVKPALFDALGLALLTTFKKCTGEEHWTSEVAQSWRKVYTHVSVVVIEDLEKKIKKSESSAGKRSSTSLTLNSSANHSSKTNPISTLENAEAVCPFSGQKLSDMPGHHQPQQQAPGGKCPVKH